MLKTKYPYVKIAVDGGINSETAKNMDNKKINWRHLILGIILNILVTISFTLIYYAYILKPEMYENPTFINYSALIQQIKK